MKLVDKKGKKGHIFLTCEFYKEMHELIEKHRPEHPPSSEVRGIINKYTFAEVARVN